MEMYAILMNSDTYCTREIDSLHPLGGLQLFVTPVLGILTPPHKRTSRQNTNAQQSKNKNIYKELVTCTCCRVIF